MPHIVAFPRWLSLTLRVLHGSKIKTCFNFSEKESKIFFLLQLQKCIVWPVWNLSFMLHIIIGQRSFQICTGDASNYTVLDSLWQDKQFDTFLREVGACSNIWPMHSPKVNGYYLGNTTICGISEKYYLWFYETQV